ncbi:MAG: hypothetical protein IPH48_07340 [bacterium]|nr:hypothetical protein [bacterium]
MRIARRLLNATFISLVNLASGVFGFWAWHLGGSTNQIAVQWPVAVVTGTAIIALWLVLLPRLHRMASGAEYVVTFLIAFPLGAAIFTAVHYVMTGYLTSLGNILAMWAILIPQVLIAGAVAASRMRHWSARAHGMVATLCLVCCAVVGCGSGSDSTSPHTLMVGDVGEFIREQTAPDGSFSIYLYRGVTMYGDMPVAEFIRLNALVDVELATEEVIHTIYNYEAIPLSAHLPGRGEADVILWTCTDGDGQDCRAGRSWSVSLDDGVLAVVARGIWRVD